MKISYQQLIESSPVAWVPHRVFINNNDINEITHSNNYYRRAVQHVPWLFNSNPVISKAVANKIVKELGQELENAKTNIKNDQEARTQLFDEIKQERQEEKIQYEKKLKTEDQKWQELLSKVEAEWDTLKNIYDNQLALKAPVQYWQKKAQTHKEASKKYFQLFALSLAITLLLTFLGLSPQGEELLQRLGKSSPSLFGLLSYLLKSGLTIIVLSLVVVRVFYKLAISNLHLANDADERVVIDSQLSSLASKR